MNKTKRKLISKRIDIPISKRCYVISYKKYGKLIKHKTIKSGIDFWEVQFLNKRTSDMIFTHDIIMPGKPLRMFELNKNYK